MSRSRTGLPVLPLLAAVVLVGAVAWIGLASSGWLASDAGPAVGGASVQRGPLRISVIERGNLKAADSVSLKSEIEGSTTILYLVPEGTIVEPGTVVCELDATQLVDRRFQQEISVRNAEAAFVKSKQNYEIQKSQNDSDIKRAEQELYFADTDLKKFREGERDAKLAQADEEIRLAEEEYARAAEKLSWSERLYEKGFLTNTELEADKLSLSRAQIGRDQAARDKDLLVRFQLPRDESALVAALEEARRELERVKLQAAARIVDFEADMRTNEAKLALEKEKLTKLETQIARAKLRAPRAGMVVYAQEEGGRYGMSQPIKEGTQVRERQEIITIPNAGGMIAQVSLHESVLKQVQIGQRCSVKVDALAGREFGGRVSYVAVLPDQNSWWANPNTRLYRTEVALEDASGEMRPGMSCAIEILVEDIADALYVPVQSVFRDGDETVAFVSRGGEVETRRVGVGRYNDRWVQITSGLEQGEVVLMSAPPGFSPQAASSTAPAAAALGPRPNAAGATTSERGAAALSGLAAGSPSVPAPSTDAAGAPGAPAADAQGPGGGERGAPGEEMRRRFESMTPQERERAAEEWRKRFEGMTPEERQKAMEQFRGRRGEGGGPGAGGGTGGAGPNP
jgi:HlyD family secretion protein